MPGPTDYVDGTYLQQIPTGISRLALEGSAILGILLAIESFENDLRSGCWAENSFGCAQKP